MMDQCINCGAMLPEDCDACPVCGFPHIVELPPADESLSTAQCLGILLIGLIPVAGVIVLCVWAFRRRTPGGRAHLARAVLVLHLLLATLVAGAAVKGAILLKSWASYAYPGFEYYDPALPYWEEPLPPEFWEDDGWDDYGEPYENPSAVHPLEQTLSKEL